MADMIDCLSWEKKYLMGGHFDTRLEDLANTIVCKGQCCPIAWDNLEVCKVIKGEDRLYKIEFALKENNRWTPFDEFMSGDLDNSDFRVVLDAYGMWMVVDTLGLEEIETGKVIICTKRETLQMTLAEAIERFGIRCEGNPKDARKFARCPALNGLCGPMHPNTGFIARYETQEVCDALSV